MKATFQTFLLVALTIGGFAKSPPPFVRKPVTQAQVTVNPDTVRFASAAQNAATTGLSSPSQAVRDAAAKALRERYVLPPASKWDALLARIIAGDSKASVLRALDSVNATPAGGAHSGQSGFENYRLDDAWILHCSFGGSGNDEKLLGRELIQQFQVINVDAPKDFTGVWTLYFANGRPSHEIHFANGKRQGTFTAFHGNGQKAFVQHYTAAEPEGEDTGYFPSGRLMYRGQYKAGVQVGTWTHYNEDGTIRSSTEHGEGAKLPGAK